MIRAPDWNVLKETEDWWAGPLTGMYLGSETGVSFEICKVPWLTPNLDLAFFLDMLLEIIQNIFQKWYSYPSPHALRQIHRRSMGSWSETHSACSVKTSGTWWCMLFWLTKMCFWSGKVGLLYIHLSKHATAINQQVAHNPHLFAPEETWSSMTTADQHLVWHSN